MVLFCKKKKIPEKIKNFVDTVFCLVLIHALKQKPKKKKKQKMCKIMNFKAKRGKNKYNMFKR